MFSVTCAGLDAPVITVLTWGILQTPREPEPRQRRSEIFRDLRQLFYFRQTLPRFGGLKLFAQPRVIFQ